MRRKFSKAAAFLFAVIMGLYWIPCVVAFAEEATEPETTAVAEEIPASIKITADSSAVYRFKTLQLKADQSNVQWSTSDKSVATVDENGLVTGIAVGRADITATKTIGDKEITGTFEVKVIERANLVSAYLSKNAILSYKYSYVDDYYFVSQNDAWQGNFGFNRMYDIAAPYILLEYDYVRVFFTYQEKDWMVQLWKGQYGLVFYGCEAGIYNKPASEEEDTVFTTYKATAGNNRPYMQTTLYHDALHNGNYKREFTTPYEQTWWSTGFKTGHLTVQEPASELRQQGVIKFKNAEMAELFEQGLKECGFVQAESKETEPDTFYRDGASVYYTWQNISEAETTMGVKYTAGSLAFLNISGFFAAVILIIASMFGMAIIGGIVLLIL